MTTSIRCMSKFLYTTKPIKNLNVISSTIREYVSSWSIPGLCEKPCATHLPSSLAISLSSFLFLTNIHLYSTGLTPFAVWTTDSKTWHFESEFNFASIDSFHKDQSFLCRHSSTNFGYGSSFFNIVSSANYYQQLH